MANRDRVLGVIGHSHKENEKRLPIHPRHIERIDPALRQRIVLQQGYGAGFGIADDALAPLVAGVVGTDELYGRSDIVLLAKPTEADFGHWREGQTIWGWPHCVQGPAITQVAIDRKMTLIAWEAMNLWRGEDVRDLHVFHKNNEIAGYAAVMHALGLLGSTGHYGRPLRAAVISFGLTARGAVHALKGLGVSDVVCVTRRDTALLHSPIPGVRHFQFDQPAGARVANAYTDDGRKLSMPEALEDFDIVVNCIYQDTDNPIFFVNRADLHRFSPGSIFIDVSCDDAMGFDFAKPTTFEEPMFKVGADLWYYAVDHTPSFLWRSATAEISEVVLKYLPDVMAGPTGWHAEKVVRKAIEIEDGVVCNPKILSFQKRSPEYPHPVLADL
jgi:alanine dehydrogenase